jgi:hypothetical protein
MIWCVDHKKVIFPSNNFMRTAGIPYAIPIW